MMTKTSEGWAVSTKTIVSILASMVVILTGIGAVLGWGFGLYSSVDKRFNSQDRRIAIAEANAARMGDDIKEVKSMVNQLLMNRVENRPDVQRWTK